MNVATIQILWHAVLQHGWRLSVPISGRSVGDARHASLGNDLAGRRTKMPKRTNLSQLGQFDMGLSGWQLPSAFSQNRRSSS